MYNIILADCKISELELLKQGLEEEIGEKFKIENKICNGKRSFLYNIYRYIIYIIFPLKYALKSKDYKYVICWQQFFGLFYAFYCRLLNKKKSNILLVCNFTYKEKRGIFKPVYKLVMNYCLHSKYIDYIHVPSREYSKKVAKDFNIPIKKFVVVPFGLDDTYYKYKDLTVEYTNYTLALGRSNRDYDFLIKIWYKMPIEEKLLIICDEFKSSTLPKNVILRNDIKFDFPYIANCKLIIMPIKDSSICSGDTVLLKSMIFSKPIVVTTPSVLADTYIQDKVNGFCIPKKEKEFIKMLTIIMKDTELQDKVSKNARKCFEKNYSRYNMGKKIGKIINI